MWQLPRIMFEALCRPGNPGSRLQMGADRQENFTKTIAGHADQEILMFAYHRVEIGIRVQLFGKSDARQIARVAALLVQLAQLCGIAAPQGDLMAGPCELDSECRAPGAGPENGDV